MQTGTRNIKSVAKKLRLTNSERDALNKLIADLKELERDIFTVLSIHAFIEEGISV